MQEPSRKTSRYTEKKTKHNNIHKTKSSSSSSNSNDSTTAPLHAHKYWQSLYSAVSIFMNGPFFLSHLSLFFLSFTLLRLFLYRVFESKFMSVYIYIYIYIHEYRPQWRSKTHSIFSSLFSLVFSCLSIAIANMTRYMLRVLTYIYSIRIALEHMNGIRNIVNIVETSITVVVRFIFNFFANLQLEV